MHASHQGANEAFNMAAVVRFGNGAQNQPNAMLVASPAQRSRGEIGAIVGFREQRSVKHG